MNRVNTELLEALKPFASTDLTSPVVPAPFAFDVLRARAAIAKAEQAESNSLESGGIKQAERVEPVALPGDLVIKALQAMDAEARKRGEMYPQTLDEQREAPKLKPPTG